MLKSDFFDEEDMQSFAHYLDKWNIDSNGYKILEMHRETSNQRQIYLGVVVPIMIFALAYFVARKGVRELVEFTEPFPSGCFVFSRMFQLILVILFVPLGTR